MFDRIVYFLSLVIYTALMGSLLVFMEANVLWVMLLLSVLPALLLWRFEQLKLQDVPLILVGALAVTTLVEGIAYYNGLWYELSPFSLRLFGLIPFEAFVFSFVQILYWITLYEYFFDDAKTSVKTLHPVVGKVLIGSVFLIGLALAYLMVFAGVFFSYPYAVLLLVCGTVFVAALHVINKNWRQVIVKAALFAVVTFPLALIFETVALASDARFFANLNEYLYVVNWFGYPVPIEEFIFIMVIPFWLVTLYELYLDDGK